MIASERIARIRKLADLVYHPCTVIVRTDTIRSGTVANLLIDGALKRESVHHLRAEDALLDLLQQVELQARNVLDNHERTVMQQEDRILRIQKMLNPA